MKFYIFQDSRLKKQNKHTWMSYKYFLYFWVIGYSSYGEGEELNNKYFHRDFWKWFQYEQWKLIVP